MSKAIPTVIAIFLTGISIGYCIAWSVIPEQVIVEKEVIKEVPVESNHEIKICIDKGGIPIRKVWDGDLKDCIFPPKPKGGE